MSLYLAELEEKLMGIRSISQEQFSNMVKAGTLQRIPQDKYDQKRSLRRVVRTLRLSEEKDKERQA